MVFINDLLDLKDRYLYLEIEGKRYPMSLNFYVADGIFFFNVDKHDDIKLHTLDDLRTCLEIEAQDSCWSGDIYIAPMDKIGSCEIRFPKNYFEDVVNNDTFDNCYTIFKMDITTDDIIIKLK